MFKWIIDALDYLFSSPVKKSPLDDLTKEGDDKVTAIFNTLFGALINLRNEKKLKELTEIFDNLIELLKKVQEKPNNSKNQINAINSKIKELEEKNEDINKITSYRVFKEQYNKLLKEIS